MKDLYIKYTLPRSLHVISNLSEYTEVFDKTISQSDYKGAGLYGLEFNGIYYTTRLFAGLELVRLQQCLKDISEFVAEFE